MSDRDKTAKIVDEAIIFVATSAAVVGAMALPNVLIALDKPLKLLYRKMDKRERAREARRIVYNMRLQGYLAGSYEHGLQLTDKARRRLERVELDRLAIAAPKRWDSIWRVVLYDIPEESKSARNALHEQLRRVGCIQLQRSVWITPFPCRDVVEALSSNYEVDQYVTYFEAQRLDNEKAMVRLFARKYPATKF